MVTAFGRQGVRILSPRPFISSYFNDLARCANRRASRRPLVVTRVSQGAKVKTSLITNDPRNDLALLKASTRPRAIAYFRSGRGIRAGADILAFGFPFKSILSDELKGTKGMINALSGFSNDTRFMQMSAPVQPGNSGGPLLDQAGNVVGVVTGKMNAKIGRAHV